MRFVLQRLAVDIFTFIQLPNEKFIVSFVHAVCRADGVFHGRAEPDVGGRVLKPLWVKLVIIDAFGTNSIWSGNIVLLGFDAGSDRICCIDDSLQMDFLMKSAMVSCCSQRG